MKTIVSSSFRAFVLNKYPTLAQNEPYLRFFQYLCFSSFFDEETFQLVIPATAVAEFYQVPRNRINAEKKLQEFRDNVLPELAWTTPSPTGDRSWTGKARQISCLGFDDEMQHALRQECRAHDEDNQVEFVSGHQYRREDRYFATSAATSEYEQELERHTLNDTQKKIVHYLQKLNGGHLFLRRIHENDRAISQSGY